MGGVETAGAGCLCPEVSLLTGVIGEVALRDGEAILVDTQAGVEHFGRSLARGFSDAIVVTDPTRNGVEAAVTAARMAAQLGIGRVHLVVNRVRSPLDRARVDGFLAGGVVAGHPAFTSVHELPYDESVLDTEPSAVALLERPRLSAAVDELVAALALEVPACAS
jgi:CO dehydrogenase maturation factor